jgi:hypothetical protein
MISLKSKLVADNQRGIPIPFNFATACLHKRLLFKLFDFCV